MYATFTTNSLYLVSVVKHSNKKNAYLLINMQLHYCIAFAHFRAPLIWALRDTISFGMVSWRTEPSTSSQQTHKQTTILPLQQRPQRPNPKFLVIKFPLLFQQSETGSWKGLWEGSKLSL